MPARIAWLTAALLAACHPHHEAEAPVANAEPPRADLTEVAPDSDVDEPAEPPSSAPDEATQHVTFDAGDATEIPADGVGTQPKREPLPSMMSNMRFAPR